MNRRYPIPTPLAFLLAMAVAPMFADAAPVRPYADALSRVELDLDGDTRVDTATVIADADGHSAVEVCLSTRENCDVIGESDATGATLVLARRAPGCHAHFREGDSPLPSRPGDVCTSADLLDVTGAGVPPSFFQYEPRTGVYTRYWLAPWTGGTND